MSSVDINGAVQLLTVLAKVGLQVVENHRNRPASAMTPAEVRLAAYELLGEVTPWDEACDPPAEPPAPEPTGEDGDD